MKHKHFIYIIHSGLYNNLLDQNILNNNFTKFNFATNSVILYPLATDFLFVIPYFCQVRIQTKSLACQKINKKYLHVIRLQSRHTFKTNFGYNRKVCKDKRIFMRNLMSLFQYSLAHKRQYVPIRIYNAISCTCTYTCICKQHIFVHSNGDNRTI